MVTIARILNGTQTDMTNEMSRERQTWIICFMLAIIAFVVTGVILSGQDPKYRNCELGFMGVPDKECRGKEATRKLLRM